MNTQKVTYQKQKLQKPKSLHQELGFLSLLVLVLSVYVIFSLTIDFLFKLPKEISHMIHIVDNIVCVVFLIDFFVRYKKAESKLQFMKWGWIDLIASIPTFYLGQAGRLFSILRILRIIRAFRSTRHIFLHIFHNRIKGTFTSVVILAIVCVLLSTLGILEAETAPNSNIKTAEDALWWSYSTITSVGYGDKYPVTSAGRLIAAVLMTVGVGLFGTFTAYVSSWFLESKQNRKR